MDKKRGKIRKYIDHAGYGFIVPDTGGSDVFFHLSGCEQGYEPREGDAVSFNLQERPDRRYRAVNVAGCVAEGHVALKDSAHTRPPCLSRGSGNVYCVCSVRPISETGARIFSLAPSADSSTRRWRPTRYWA